MALYHTVACIELLLNSNSLLRDLCTWGWLFNCLFVYVCFLFVCVFVCLHICSDCLFVCVCVLQHAKMYDLSKYQHLKELLEDIE